MNAADSKQQDTQEKSGAFGINMSIVEKVEIMFQKNPKEIMKKNQLLKKFDEDYKKFKKGGE